MTHDSRTETEGERRFNAITAAYIRAVERGEVPDRDKIVARDPDLADRLRRFFENDDGLNRMLAPLRKAVQTPRVESEVTIGFQPSHPGRVLETLAKSIGSIPRVLLPDTQVNDPGAPLVQPSSTEMPPPGDRADRYQIFGEIAHGGMGAILKGRDTDLGRELAVKVLLERHQDEPEMVRRFVEEAQIGGQLQHPGIVPVYELGTFSDQRPYFTMKLVKGRTLAAILSDRKGIFDDLPRLLGIFEQICQTLAYAHARSVIHRDLKPSNIMVGGFGEVQVMDWGLAKVLKPGGAAEEESTAPAAPAVSVIRTVRSGSAPDASRAGSVLGTLAYMPPEQAWGEVEKVDQRADVFGLGSILCEILTGQPAYTGRTADEVRRKAERGDTADALKRLGASQCDPDLVVLAKDCLVVEPLDRPRDASIVLARITAYLTGVQEKLRAAELARVEAHARAEEEVKRRELADRLTVAAEGRAVAEVRRRKATLALAGMSTAAVILLAGMAVGLVYHRRLNTAFENEQRSLYFNRIALAEREWQGNNGPQAEQLLDECAPARRGWEWDYLKLAIHSEFSTIPGHRSPVFGVAFSPDGRRIASASAESVKVWDATTRQLLSTHKVKELGAGAASVAFSPDSKRLAAGLGDQNRNQPRPSAVWIWNAETGEQLRFPGHLGVIRCVAFSPDGKRVASACEDRTARIWNAETGALIKTLRDKTQGFTSVTFSRDGRYLASATGDRDEYALVNKPGKVTIWDTTTWQVVHALTNHAGSVNWVAYSRDGGRLASASSDKTVKIWDTKTGHELRTLRRHTQFVTGVAFSPDGKRVVSASEDGSLKVWDAEKKNEENLFTLWGHVGMVNCVAYSPDGTQVASGSDDKTVRLWDARKAPGALTLGGEDRSWFTSIAFSADGKRLAAANADHTVTVWDALTRREIKILRGHTDPIWSVAFSPDPRFIASACGVWDRPDPPGNVRVWDLTTDGVVILPSHVAIVWSVAFSPDGRLIATGGGELVNGPAELKLWDARTGKELRRLVGHTVGVSSVAFSPDGKHLASAANDAMVKVWDVGSGRELLTCRKDGSAESAAYGISAAFSRDGQFLASAGIRGVTIWSAATGSEVQVFHGHISAVRHAVFNRKGDRLATAGDDGTVKIWDVGTGQEVLTLRGHTGQVCDVAFSPDARQLVSASRDGTVRIWDSTPSIDPKAPPAAARRSAISPRQR